MGYDIPADHHSSGGSNLKAESIKEQLTPIAEKMQPLSRRETVQDSIIQHLNRASHELMSAYQQAVNRNPMAADLPVFQQMKLKQAEITAMMQAVSKVRGLD